MKKGWSLDHYDLEPLTSAADHTNSRITSFNEEPIVLKVNGCRASSKQFICENNLGIPPWVSSPL